LAFLLGQREDARMARVLVTGSADGLGLVSAQILADQKHEVTLHARNDARADHARKQLPNATHVVVGDFSTLAGMHAVVEQANAIGRYDAVIHNAGIGYHLPKAVHTEDGLEQTFAINVLAPYVLTALMPMPARLIYLTSGMHRGGDSDLSDAQWKSRRWNGSQAYSDTKLFDVVLAFAIARRYPKIFSNAVHPGWVATKMGGRGAPDDLHLGGLTQAWLAVSDDEKAKVSGKYFFHQKIETPHADSHDEKIQDALLAYCESISAASMDAA
jgi:NAD(P)-dependent dehydrogenase (short-subunit alcohol dehydrogenase family)